MKTPWLLLLLIVALAFGGCKSSQQSVRKTQSADGQIAKPSKQHPTDDLPVPDSEMARQLVEGAKTWLGVPYRYGGTSRSGADCSGFMMTLFNDVAGIKLPRNSAKQREYCNKVKRNQLKPGDLVFFTNNKRGSKINHVGLYVGADRMIHASSSRGVIMTSINDDYWAPRYHSSGRVPAVAAAHKSKKARQAKQRPAPRSEPQVVAQPSAAPRPRKTPEITLDKLVSASAQQTDSIKVQKTNSAKTQKTDSVKAQKTDSAKVQLPSAPVDPPRLRQTEHVDTIVARAFSRPANPAPTDTTSTQNQSGAATPAAPQWFD